MSEIRVTDPKTGGQKGRKSDRFDLIPADFERALAEHYGKGAEKYEDRNWERGYDWSLSYRALRSHLAWWWAKQDFDAETGSNHLIAVAWHAIALYTFQTRGLGTDDRPTVGPLNAPKTVEEVLNEFCDKKGLVRPNYDRMATDEIDQKVKKDLWGDEAIVSEATRRAFAEAELRAMGIVPEKKNPFQHTVHRDRSSCPACQWNVYHKKDKP